MAGTASSTALPASYNVAKNNLLTREQIDEYEVESSTAVFVYGSLMLPNLAVRRIKDSATEADEMEVAGRMTRATLKGFRRHAVRHTVFPAVLDNGSEEDTVEGMVLFGLTESELQRLDRFESGIYFRVEVAVNIELQDGDSIECFVQAYVFARDENLLLDPAVTTWTLEQFIQTEDYSNLIQDT